MEKGGTIVHAERPYLSASLDYLQRGPTGALMSIVEIKSWTELPSVLPQGTWHQAVTQLAISIKSTAVDWGEAEPLVTVFAAKPGTEDALTYLVRWDEESRQEFEYQIAPKAHRFFMGKLLPELVVRRGPAAAAAAPGLGLAALGQGATPPPPTVDLHGVAELGSGSPERLANQTPSFTLGKTVHYSRTGKSGIITKLAGEKVFVEWQGEDQQRMKPVKLEYLLVPAMAPEDIVPPTAVGQRVLISSGPYNRSKGTITSFNQ